MFDKNEFINHAKEVADNGIFLSHWYQVEYKRQNIIHSSSFPDLDSAYEEYKRCGNATLTETEVWQYNNKQEVVVYTWYESKKKFVLE